MTWPLKVLYVIYEDFEALVRKIHRCERKPEIKANYTEKTEQYEACGCSYTVVRSDGEVLGSNVYRAENEVGIFLSDILHEEMAIRESLATPKPLLMKAKDWEKHKNATECHICNESLMKDLYLDSIPVYDHDPGDYCGQSHKGCYYVALKEMEFSGPKGERKERDKIDQWIADNQKTCLFCAEPLLKQNHKDSVKDHCHITGMCRGAAHSACNKKLRINPKAAPIPVVFDNLRGYDAHHLMQAMSQLQKEVRCIANNMEKYLTFSAGGVRFIDSFNFLQERLDSLVSATPKESLKMTAAIANGSELLYKKGIYPCEYMDSWDRIGETRLPDKEKFYSKLNDEHITDEEYAHAHRV